MSHPVKEMLDKLSTFPRGSMFFGFCERAHELVAVLCPSAIRCVWNSEGVTCGEIGLKVVTLCMMFERVRKEMRGILPNPSALRDEGTVDLVSIHGGE